MKKVYDDTILDGDDVVPIDELIKDLLEARTEALRKGAQRVFADIHVGEDYYGEPTSAITIIGMRDESPLVKAARKIVRLKKKGWVQVTREDEMLAFLTHEGTPMWSYYLSCPDEARTFIEFYEQSGEVWFHSFREARDALEEHRRQWELTGGEDDL